METYIGGEFGIDVDEEILDALRGVLYTLNRGNLNIIADDYYTEVAQAA